MRIPTIEDLEDCWSLAEWSSRSGKDKQHAKNALIDIGIKPNLVDPLIKSARENKKEEWVRALELILGSPAKDSEDLQTQIIGIRLNAWPHGKS